MMVYIGNTGHMKKSFKIQNFILMHLWLRARTFLFFVLFSSPAPIPVPIPILIPILIPIPIPIPIPVHIPMPIPIPIHILILVHILVPILIPVPIPVPVRAQTPLQARQTEAPQAGSRLLSAPGLSQAPRLPGPRKH